MMQEKAQQWINLVHNGHLHWQNVWFSLKVQFWPRIGYGLCSSMATLQELNWALHCQYYQIISLGGIVRTTTAESMMIDEGFFRVGLPHFRGEVLIAMATKLSMHYRCKTAMGKLMQTSYSLLFVALGLLFQPLQESYNRYGILATHSWMKMLWEKLSKFDMKVIVMDFNQKQPV
jgi:hypothetical protein